MLARLRPRPQTGPAAPRRADRRRRPAVAGSALGRLPQDGGRRHHYRGLEPRDGRGRTMRPPWIDALRQAAGRRERRRNQVEGRCRPVGGCLPQAVGGFFLVSASRVGAITKRILQQFPRDHRTLGLRFGGPLVILALLGYLLRGGGDVPKMGIVNLDGGLLGGIVASTLERSKTVSASSMSPADADGKLRSGDIAGYVLLPSDFSPKAQQARVIAPEIHLEGSQPGLSQSILQAVSQSFVGLAGQGGGIQFTPKITFLYGGPSFDTLDYFGAAFIGLVVFFLVFVITAVAFLRERGQGTLERLMASPLRRAEIVLGYMLGFTVLALVQSAEVLAFSLLVLHVHNVGNVALIFVLEALMAIAAVNLGIFLSMFARTEFQAVQFIPLVIVPQMLLAGIIFPVSTEPGPLQALSHVLPLTYAVEGLRNIMIKGADLTWSSLQLDFAVVLGFCILVILAGATTLRRRIA